MPSELARPGPTHPRIAIIGGGISGLAAAFHLRELVEREGRPVEIVLLERTGRLGGTIQTLRRDGYVAETGPDSFIAEKPWALQLIGRIGLRDEVIGTREGYRKTYIVHDGYLVELPEGFMLMAPVKIVPFLRSSLFSLRAKLRIAAEPLIPRRREESDESLAAFVTRRLGRELLDRVVQPLAGGIYTADPKTLSLRATMPRFIEMERRYGSIIRGLMAAQKLRQAAPPSSSPAGGSPFLSLRQGLSVFIERLGEKVGEAARLQSDVVEIAPIQSGAGWRLALADGPTLDVDAVICATPAYAAGRLVREVAPSLARLLEGIRYASSATVNMALRGDDFTRLPPSGYGFVVPAIEGRKIIAGSFSSLKFASRAPDGAMLVRAFIGGAMHPEAMNLTDEEMAAAATEEFRKLAGLSAEPSWVNVQRWKDALPQYEVGHLDRVAGIEQELSRLPGLALAGSAYHGVGMPDCVHSGEQAAEAVFAHVASRAA